MTKEQLESLSPNERIIVELMMEISVRLKRLAETIDKEMTPE